MAVSINQGKKVTVTLKKGTSYSIRGIIFKYGVAKEAPENIATYLLKYKSDRFAKGKWTPPKKQNSNAGDMSADDLKSLHEEVLGGGDDDSSDTVTTV